MNTFQINARVEWHVSRSPAGALIAVCDPLGLTLEASSDEELMSLINEGQHVLFADLLADGELEKFLLERGWTANGPVPSRMPEGGMLFDVPTNVIRDGHAHA